MPFVWPKAAALVFPEAEQDRLSARGAGAVVLAAFLLTAAGLTLHLAWRPDFNKNSVDGFYYATLAQNLAAGRGYTTGAFPQTLYYPLYPIAIAAVYLAIGRVELAAHLVNVLALGVYAFFTYALLRRIFARRDLAAAGVVLSLAAPDLLYHSSLMITEALFCALLSAAAYTALGLAERPETESGRAHWLLLGALGGLLYLTRPEAIAYLGAIGAYLIARRPRWREAANWAVAAAAFLICVSPWVIYLSRLNHTFTFFGKAAINLDIGAMRGGNRGINVAHIFNAPAADGTGVRLEEPEKFGRLATAADNWFAYPRHLAEHLRRLERLAGFAGLLLPLGILFFLVRRRGWQLLYLAALAAVQLAIPFYFSEPRFVTQAIPFVIAVELAGGVQLAVWLLSRAGRPALAAAAAITLTAALLAPIAARHYGFYFAREPEFERQQREMRALAADAAQEGVDLRGRQVIAYRPWFAFYTGAVHREMPNYAAPDELPRYLARNRIPFLLLSRLGDNDLSLDYRAIAADPAAFGLHLVAARSEFLLLRAQNDNSERERSRGAKDDAAPSS
jgi:4-amino-4-deoxy-L-arabinose transferase-like glycosyltransferase